MPAETTRFGIAPLRRFSSLALEQLAAAREEIDALNVYPIPDGDTGTNLFLTFESAHAALQTSLEAPLRTEGAAIESAAQALNGKPADAALQARATAFEKKRADAERQLSTRQQTFQRNRAHVLQQINTKLEPAVATVMTRRGASLVLDATQTIRSAPALDITADVITALNAGLPSISTTAPAPAAPTRR